MKLPGIVTNITNFGCFVDMGIKENGLVHISELADHFVSNPNEVVSLHQHVEVKVLSVDMERKRIALSMKNENGEIRNQRLTDAHRVESFSGEKV